MRGHIVKRGKDSYSISVYMGVDPATGKKRYQWLSVKGNKRDAEKRLAELLHQLDTGTFVKPDKLLFGAFLDQWLKDYCECNLAPNTTQTYAWFVERHIKPVLGQTPLSKLRPEHLQRLYSDKLNAGRRNGTGGLGERSVRYIHTTIHRALKSAVKLGMVARNVADSVDVPTVKRREMRTMGEQDIGHFLEYARITPYYPLCYLALFTGMRRSELLALKWTAVDLLLCQLSVTRTMHQLHNREIIFRQPKTAKSRRLIALSPSTVAVLREHREAQERLCQTLGITFSEDRLVFCQPDGRPFLPDSITQAWRHLAHRAGLDGIRLHDCRHTHASLLLKQGVHPKIVQERLGHASIQITLDTYSHVAPGLQAAAAARFDEGLGLSPRPVAGKMPVAEKD